MKAITKQATVNFYVCETRNISPMECLYLSVIHNLSVANNHSNDCLATNKELAETLDLSVRTIQSMSDKLQKQGYLIRGQTITSKQLSKEIAAVFTVN